MVLFFTFPPVEHLAVSVLALSSRFDGHPSPWTLIGDDLKFQYSLCRVVLMVAARGISKNASENVSVLALSSRFDGLPRVFETSSLTSRFSTRSVESF